MRLEHKNVQFISSFLPLGLIGGAPRFVGKEKSIHLRETAFVVEGSILKVVFLGIEGIFQRAITENTSLTIPYQRMQKATVVRWPPLRVFFSLLLLLLPLAAVLGFALIPNTNETSGLLTFLYLLCAIGWIMSLYIVLRIRPRFEVGYLNKNNKRCYLLFHIKPKPLLKEFDQQLHHYLDSARQFQWRPARAAETGVQS